jgi:hypothetical protein
MMGENGKPVGDNEELISLDNDQVDRWSQSLGVTVNELQVAVEKVGPRLADVRRFLRK